MKHKNQKLKHSKVECILGKKVENMIAYYKVKWQGMGIENATWEPFSKLKLAENLIFDYEDKLIKEGIFNKAYHQSQKTIGEVRLSPERKLSEILEMHQQKRDLKLPKSHGFLHEVSVVIDGTKKWGDLSNGDIPNKILGVTKLNYSNDILYHVDWKPNSFGFKPLQSQVNSNQLEKNHSNLIIDFLESKLKFG